MTRRLADTILVGMFILGLGAFAVTSLGNTLADRIGWNSVFDREQTWKALTNRIEDHFGSHVTGREAIVQWYARCKSEWLGASPNPKVWMGRNGWLFFNHSAEHGFISPHDPALAARLDGWAHALTVRREWLADRGIKYLVVAAPDKQSIYPEQLPRLARRRGPTPLDGFLARCAQDSELTLLDLRPQLKAARSDETLYRFTDTHWTANGAYAGYAATVNSLSHWHAQLIPQSPSEFTMAIEPSAGGDLARLLGLGSFFLEDVPQLERKVAAHARLTNEPVVFQPEPLLSHVQPRVWVNDQAGLPRVVLLGDSFADDTFCELLAEHCSRLVRVGSYQGQEALIEREKPDVVICQFVERMLEGYTPRGPH